MAGRRCEFASAGFSGPIREPPLPPPMRSFADQSFVMLGFHYGFSGNAETEVGSRGALSAPLASTYGVSLRGDVPIERFLLLGPLFQFGAWRGDMTPPPSYSYYIDVDLYVRGRIPITVKSTSFQFWAGVPIGLTFQLLGPELPGTSGAGLGWNVGFLGGGAVHFSPKIGLFAEIGWVQHKVTHGGDPDSYYVRLAQWNFNIGFVFAQ
jgi:hypothetical protein